MSSRTRGKRGPPPTVEPVAESSTSTSRSRTRTKPTKPEPSPEIVEEDFSLGDEEALALGEAEDDVLDHDQDGEDEEEEDPTPSKARSGRKGKSKGKGRGRPGFRGKPKLQVEEDEDAQGEDEEEEEEDAEEEIKPSGSRRLRKSVSYKEIPVESLDVEEQDDDNDEVAIGDEEEEVQPRKRKPPIRLSSQSSSTPRKKSRPSIKATPSNSTIPIIPPGADDGEEDGDEDGEDETDSPYKLEKIPGGSGRGGFSVKGAAAAAARARWDKVRREKIERGEDPDEPRSSARKPKRVRVPIQPDADTVEMDSTVTIKGEEYKVGDDEVILPDDVKGDTKVDAEGRLQGGREYKLVTFTSEHRRNPQRLYAMTIDAARACGYTDSLAFLRRCPQILKLSCTAEERQLLIDIGRIAGNLRHRQVTMVSVRNVYKLMGARVIKGGKWVTDDYYEDEALIKCQENGWEPNTLAEDEESTAQANTQASHSTKQPVLGDTTRTYTYNLTPFYTIGGPTTTFAGNGVDPWSEAGWGNKRQKLKGSGVTESDWIFRTAEQARRIDDQLKSYRNERLSILEGTDSINWVYKIEMQSEEKEAEAETEIEPEIQNGLLMPNLDRKRSGLSQDVTRELTQELEEQDTSKDVEMIDVDRETDIEKPKGPEIIVEQPNEISNKFHWGLGTWAKGVIKAAYEPHTQMPHVPLHTQPTSATFDRISYHPIISSHSSSNNHAQSTLMGPSSRGIASVEYVFENSETDVKETREKVVRDAIEWEKEMRRRRRLNSEDV
ncbi:uncharacterized protein IL334_003403 [Kwoniella shivajii]|uniref:Chromatin structure-remodeling complex protein RSC7 n=1 Tax=Kwoniella shivajii TaxID=564305 RepID=A0ABZ1CXG4_9TREE|nr:hypothetical protein IL334_003403 [Kwoniella shivajii]